MAQRPIFMPQIQASKLVDEQYISFEWHPGFALSQMQKSIKSLHTEAAKKGISPILEISSKSLQPLGVQLSAFNLRLSMHEYNFSVEAAYQGSKVFKAGGPFTDIYNLSSREAKKDERLKIKGELLYFDLFDQKWNLQPTTAFYDWLYLNALIQNRHLSDELVNYVAFSDIAFNPEKSFSCQARSAALYVSLLRAGNLDLALSNPSSFLSFIDKSTGQSTEKDFKQNRLI